MPMAVICGQRINSIHISVLWWPLMIYTETLFGILRKESMSAIYVNNNIDFFWGAGLSATSNLLAQCIVSSFLLLSF